MKRKPRLTKKQRKNQPTVAFPPRFDPDLPKTVEEIHAAQSALLLQIPNLPGDGFHLVSQGRRGIANSAPDQLFLKIMRLQKQLFRATFNREPTLHDPLVWDPEHEDAGPLKLKSDRFRSQLSSNAVKAGLRLDMAYAMGKTGMVITEQNKDMFSKEEIEEWQAAVKEYRDTHGE